MCGIVGLFLKDASLEKSLGNLLSDMLVTMTDRGPDSAELQSTLIKTLVEQSLLYSPITLTRILRIYQIT